MVRSQAQKALDLDPSLPEGHAMLGAVAGSLEYDWKEAERHFRLAIAHDPVSGQCAPLLLPSPDENRPAGRSRSAGGARTAGRSAQSFFC